MGTTNQTTADGQHTSSRPGTAANRKERKLVVGTEQMRQRALEVIQELDLEKPWQIEIKRYQKNRSLQANALYWKWLSIIHNETGQDKDDVHEVMMRKFLEPRIVHRSPGAESGPAFEVYSTRRLTTAQFSEYLDKIHAWASSFGIHLPLPEEMHLEKMP